jgi:hypothetical protein
LVDDKFDVKKMASIAITGHFSHQRGGIDCMEGCSVLCTPDVIFHQQTCIGWQNQFNELNLFQLKNMTYSYL